MATQPESRADHSTGTVERHQQRSIHTPAQLRFAEEALLLFVTVAKLRAANRGRELARAGALMLDNPLGKPTTSWFWNSTPSGGQGRRATVCFLPAWRT